MDRRGFMRAGAIGAGLGLAAAAAAQRDPAAQAARIARERSGAARTVPNRKLRTTRLFESPEGAPNAIAASDEGLWIGEQLTDDGQGRSNTAYLVDWSGVMYGCDAGIHPQWADGRSPSSGTIFRIDPA